MSIARNDILESLFVIRLRNMVNFELLGEEIEKTGFSVLSQVQNKEKILFCSYFVLCINLFPFFFHDRMGIMGNTR